MSVDFASVGGTQDAGNWNFGWISPADRTPDMEAAHGNIVGGMPRFAISGTTDESEDKVDLTEIWMHPEVVAALGYAFPGIHQYTGSCVGAGGGATMFTLAALEVLRLHDPEQIIVPFWLLPYGRSRYYAGMRGRGEGSMGSTFAKAAKTDGVIPATLDGLPKFENSDGLSWYKSAEYAWSDGGSIDQKWLDQSRKHLVKQVSQMQSADDVEQAIRNLYPCTNASSLIPNPRMEGGEAFGRVARAGGHQTSFLGVWRHPTKGRHFKYVNQWGLGWGKDGACWIPESDVNAIVRDGEETYAFSQFDGFPSQKISWLI